MKTKLISCVVALVMLLAFSPVATADQIMIGYGQDGGKFSIHDSLNNYLYDSFCLELNENFALNTPYYFTIDTFAWNGGRGGQTPSEPTQDDLDPMTAYLYYQFRTGQLAGFDKNDPADTFALQAVIWFIEDEHNIGAVSEMNAAELAFYTDAFNAVTGGAWIGLGPVRVLNPYTIPGFTIDQIDVIPIQSQLTLVPEPMTLLLLGLGLFGLGIAGRKLGK